MSFRSIQILFPKHNYTSKLCTNRTELAFTWLDFLIFLSTKSVRKCSLGIGTVLMNRYAQNTFDKRRVLKHSCIFHFDLHRRHTYVRMDPILKLMITWSPFETQLVTERSMCFVFVFVVFVLFFVVLFWVFVAIFPLEECRLSLSDRCNHLIRSAPFNGISLKSA